MNSIVAIAAGVIQDASDNSYDKVIILYMALSAGSLLATLILLGFSFSTTGIGSLQWTRKQRFAKKDLLNDRIRAFYNQEFAKNRLISKICFSMVMVLMLGGWTAFIWGAATGNNYS